MIDYSLTQVVNQLRSSGKTPPTWLLTGVYVSLIASIYMFGVTHGIQIGAATQALGDVMIPPEFLELPFPVIGGSRFIPSADMWVILDRAQYTALAFAAIALAGIGGWLLHEVLE